MLITTKHLKNYLNKCCILLSMDNGTFVISESDIINNPESMTRLADYIYATLQDADSRRVPTKINIKSIQLQNRVTGIKNCLELLNTILDETLSEWEQLEGGTK